MRTPLIQQEPKKANMVRIRIKDPNPREAKSQELKLVNKMPQRLATPLINQKFFQEQVEKILSNDIKLKIIKKSIQRM